MNEAQERLDSLQKFAVWMRINKPGYYSSVPGWIEEYASKQDGNWWWKQREMVRQDVRLVPNWLGSMSGYVPNIHDFFVFISRKDPLRIAYTPTDEDGLRDRQVITTVGRFLNKHYPSVPEDFRRHVANQHRVSYGSQVVYFAFGAAAIEKIYRNGPQSCMGNKGDWRQGEHPTRVYDGPDTGMAYLVNASDRISARTVIRVDTTPMRYTRTYGDESILGAQLSKLGFEHECSLSGVRLRLEEKYGAHVCPFIDGTEYGEPESGFLVLNDEGGGSAQRTDGICGNEDGEDEDDEREFCERCEDYTHEQMHETMNNGWVCSDCIDDCFVTAIVHRHGYTSFVHEDEVISVKGVWYYNDDDLLSELGFVYIEAHDDWYPSDEVTQIDDEPHKNEDVCYIDDEPHLKEECTQDYDLTWRLKDTQTQSLPLETA